MSSEQYKITTTLLGLQGPAGVGVKAGGTQGQLLAKETNADFDTTWIDVSANFKQNFEPEAAADGDLWFNTDTNQLFYKRSIGWVELTTNQDLDNDLGQITMNGGYF